jgi:uncharacterized surface protein with fasciclin (FAS1) repeats
MTRTGFAAAAAAIAGACLLGTTLAATLAAPALAHSGGCEQSGVRTISNRTPAAPATVVDVAASSNQFTTLVAAVQAAGLVPTLTGPGPFTVFAPTDAAFAKLPGGTVESLLRPENRDQLVRILTYHVVPGRITSDQLAGRTTRTRAVSGQNLAVDGRTGVRVNGSTVIRADIQAGNGVVHVIDTVLLPPATH